jgi:heat shock protein HslJ
MKALILFSLTILLSFDKSSTSNLSDTSWNFIKLIDKKNNTTLLSDVSCKTSLSFDDQGKYSGYSGWNYFDGTYSAKNNYIQLSDPARTKKAGLPQCEHGETLYLHYKNARTYSITADTLKIFSLDSIVIVLSRRQ